MRYTYKVTLIHQEKACSKCDKVKSLTEFHKGKTESSTRAVCKSCRNKYYAKNRWTKMGTIEGLLSERLKDCNRRARKKGIECTLTRDQLLDLWHTQNHLCAVTGKPMLIRAETVTTGPSSDTISVDRIDSTKGYVIDNIQLVRSVVNIMKTNSTPERFISVCREVIEHYDKTK